MKNKKPAYYVGYQLALAGPPITVTAIVPDNTPNVTYRVELSNGHAYDHIPATWIREDHL